MWFWFFIFQAINIYIFKVYLPVLKVSTIFKSQLLVFTLSNPNIVFQSEHPQKPPEQHQQQQQVTIL